MMAAPGTAGISAAVTDSGGRVDMQRASSRLICTDCSSSMLVAAWMQNRAFCAASGTGDFGPFVWTTTAGGVGPPASGAGRTALLGDSPWPDHGFVRQPSWAKDGGRLRAG